MKDQGRKLRTIPGVSVIIIWRIIHGCTEKRNLLFRELHEQDISQGIEKLISYFQASMYYSVI